MSEKKVIIAAAALGTLVLGLLLIIIRPFSKFESEYPMTAASGSAVDEDGMTIPGQPGSEDEGAGGQGDTTGTGDTIIDAVSGAGASGGEGISIIDPMGDTLETRINVPEGFTRTEEEVQSLGTFLRSFELEPDGSPVLLYNGEEKADQSAHAAVFKLKIGKEDLQQCADSVMRMYAEYFWKTGEKDRISFSLDDSFKADYSKWRQGYRISETENSYEWVNSEDYDDSRKSFNSFMRLVFAYSGTYNLKTDSKRIGLKKLRIGDIFLHAGSPGHVVMVVDTAESADGRKAFLLAQGYMPAQQFQLLKNPMHEGDPWYYLDEMVFPFITPEYTFEKKCLMRPQY